ncbi:IS630 transposase-related protein, partial [Holospora curviuscula]|uniref:IS630 transposase-related protein n=1 Tax=Holospora curviuscula TaxID=1082868 RepID=UPI003C6C748B
MSKDNLRNNIEQFPDSDRRESGEKLGISESGIHYAPKPLGVTYKNNTLSCENRS